MPSINRRMLLKASGISLTLPMLETLGQTNETPHQKLVTVGATLGLYSDWWFPKTGGTDYEPSPYLKLIDNYRSQYTIFSGLEHKNQSGRQAHNSEITWLTSAEHPGLDGFQNTLSLDQAAAKHNGYVTRFPSIVMGTTSPQSQSYTASGVMVPAETSPSKIFTDLFLQGDPKEVARHRQSLNDGGSILDHLQEETANLNRRVSSMDKIKLNNYLEAIREAEVDLTEVRAWLHRPKPETDIESPVDVTDPNDTIGKVRRMMRLIPLILATDSSRVVSLMIQDHGVVPNVPGVTGEHHGLSHHGKDPEKIEQLKKIEMEIVKAFRDLLASLTEPGPGGSLLDTTSVLFGSNLGNANSHSATALPILVAGGPFVHGQHIVQKENPVPLSNLFLALLQGIGLPIDHFGHSTNVLHWS